MFIEQLSAKQWTPAHTAEVSYPASFATIETPPAPPDAPDGEVQKHLAYKHAQIQAHDGDLVYFRKGVSDSAPTYGTGHRRVYQGTSFIIQMAYGDTLYIGGVGGEVSGAVIWGR